MISLNVFVLDANKQLAAQYHCDKHIVKMVTETAQLLSSAYYSTGEHLKAPYRLSHFNHPWAAWARENMNNWIWLLQFGIALYGEYDYRYHREHKGGLAIAKMLHDRPNLPQDPLSPMPLCMPEPYKTKDVVESYRNYYNGDKYRLFKWTGRPRPYWARK